MLYRSIKNEKDPRDKQIEELQRQVRQLSRMFQSQTSTVQRLRASNASLQDQVGRLPQTVQRLGHSLDTLNSRVSNIANWLQK